MLARIKRALVWLSVGAFAGFVGWSLVGRSLTSLTFGSIGGTFTCRADVETALGEFVSMQLYSALGGAVISLLILLVAARRRMKRAKAATSTDDAMPVPGAPS